MIKCCCVNAARRAAVISEWLPAHCLAAKPQDTWIHKKPHTHTRTHVHTTAAVGTSWKPWFPELWAVLSLLWQNFLLLPENISVLLLDTNITAINRLKNIKLMLFFLICGTIWKQPVVKCKISHIEICVFVLLWGLPHNIKCLGWLLLWFGAI